MPGEHYTPLHVM